MNDAATLLPEDEARARILALAAPLSAEWVALEEGLGRTLAEDVMAQRTLPPWDNSAMDGYAVRAADLAGALPVRLPVLETVFAGGAARQDVRAGTCVRIMTGAPLPAGADAVVMRERVRPVPDGGVDEVDVLEAAVPGQFVRPRGEDAREGELLLARGTPLGIPELGLLWGQGMLSAPVPRAPRVAILSTGDELCRADEPPEAASSTPTRRRSPSRSVARGACHRCWASPGTHATAWRRPSPVFTGSTWCSPARASPWASATT